MKHRISHKKYNGHRVYRDVDSSDLPPNTMRLKYVEGYTPSFPYGTGTQLSQTPNIWDYTFTRAWYNLLGDVNLIEVIDWNFGTITSIGTAFKNCFNLEKVHISHLPENKILPTTYGYGAMFDNCYALTEITGMDGAIFTGSCYNMFHACSKLKYIPTISIQGVWDLSGMFDGCESITSIHLFETSSATNVRRMFQSCRNLTTIPLFNLSNVTNMSQFLKSCSSLVSIPALSTSNVTDISFMFDSCESLTSIPLLNTSNATNMKFMFFGCDSLTIIPLLATNKVTDVSYMFYSCGNVETGALALYNQMINQTTTPTNHTSTFTNCGANTQTGAAELSQIPVDWK